MGLCPAFANAQAAPISFTEPPLLSDSPFFPTPLGSLDVGVNTVSGLVFCITFPFCMDPDDRTDAFAVFLPATLQINSITFNVSNLTGLTTTGSVSSFHSGTPAFNQTFAANGLLNLFSGVAAGPSNLVFENSVFSRPPDFIFRYNYVWSITVEESSQAPEPGTLALLGVALAGLGWSRRQG